MTLYRLTWTARPSPFHYIRCYAEYFGSMDSAKAAQRIVSKTAIDVEAIEQVTVPTDKAGLLAFLNAESQPRRVE